MPRKASIVEGVAMAQASWNGTASTIPAFITSLFSTSVRNASAMESAVAGGALNYSFTDDATRGLILNAWLAAWQSHNGDPYNSAALSQCPQTDQTLIGFLSDYIKNGSLSLCTPNLAYATPQPANATLAVYSNSGYGAQAFRGTSGWNYGVVSSNGEVSIGNYADDTVAAFLFQLFHGAHFVVVSNPQELGGSGPPQFWNSFLTSSLDTSGDKVNSHYSDANLTGYYYLNVTSDKEPSTNPLLVSFLAGLTDPAELTAVVAGVTAGAAAGTAVAGSLVLGPTGVAVTASAAYAAGQLASDLATSGRRSASNTFIQLEGWQNHFPYWTGFGGNKWHMADYEMHEKTLWNFSTFGASVYSEKRCAPLFLANADFSLAINPTTNMPLYTGAMSTQPWMKPNLLQVG
jgi:hypothetical protein